MNPYRSKYLRGLLKSIPKSKIDYENKKQEEEAKEIYKKFITNFNRGKCYFCCHSLNSFVKNDPCFHWLLLPDGIVKKDLINYLSSGISFYRLESYLRWVANVDFFIGNINDLEQDKPNNDFIIETIKYKNIEWTLHIGLTDLEGHERSAIANKPHYHIQILKNDKSYVKFNDVHIPLSDHDLFTFECSKQAGDIFKISHAYGEGISLLEEAARDGWLDKFDEISKNIDDPSKATIHRSTMISTLPGKKISSDLLADAIEESQKTKEPIGRILSRLDSELQIETILEPSENIPEMKKRSQRKK